MLPAQDEPSSMGTFPPSPFHRVEGMSSSQQQTEAGEDSQLLLPGLLRVIYTDKCF